ncbi:TIR domain-containing protein [Paenibacillus kandeliae]|uniref:TIR domain-containing protein n=1 Tax=Paenibacillus kandeliae TaxID=3231269 RepID=UPI00345AC05C
MHKTFLSYHHKNDQDIKDYIVKNFGKVNFIDKSVSDNDINTSNQQDTIMKIIRRDFLADSTVTIVIVGSETAQRPFINSEIQASLWGPNYSGLLAIVRDEIYEKIFEYNTCKSLSCNCNRAVRLQTNLYKYYLPDLVYRNHEYLGSLAHYTDQEVYCAIVKFSAFIICPETYINQAFEKRNKNFDVKKRLLPKTPKIEARNFGGFWF